MKTNGIRPPTHGNSGKKPYNAFEEIKFVVHFSKRYSVDKAFPCRLLQEEGTQNQQLSYPVQILRRTSMIYMLKPVKKSPPVRKMKNSQQLEILFFTLKKQTKNINFVFNV